MKVENDISKHIVTAAIEVHRTIGGPGLLETVYEESLVYELETRWLRVQRQLEVPIAYKEKQLSSPLRLDLLVENKVIVEVKSVANYNPIFQAQALTYLRLLQLRLALVINFGERYVKDGIYRVVN